MAAKDSLRSFYGVDRFDNAFYVSETFAESLIDRDFLFMDNSVGLFGDSSIGQVKSISAPDMQGKTSLQNPNIFLMQHLPELALVLISPTLVSNNDFVYVLEDLHRSKFGICSL